VYGIASRRTALSAVAIFRGCAAILARFSSNQLLRPDTLSGNASLVAPFSLFLIHHPSLRSAPYYHNMFFFMLQSYLSSLPYRDSRTFIRAVLALRGEPLSAFRHVVPDPRPAYHETFASSLLLSASTTQPRLALRLSADPGEFRASDGMRSPTRP